MIWKLSLRWQESCLSNIKCVGKKIMQGTDMPYCYFREDAYESICSLSTTQKSKQICCSVACTKFFFFLVLENRNVGNWHTAIVHLHFPAYSSMGLKKCRILRLHRESYLWLIWFFTFLSGVKKLTIYVNARLWLFPWALPNKV